MRRRLFIEIFSLTAAVAATAAKEAVRQAPVTASPAGQPTKYVPPSLRGGGDNTQRRGETMQNRRSLLSYLLLLYSLVINYINSIFHTRFHRITTRSKNACVI